MIINYLFSIAFNSWFRHSPCHTLWNKNPLKELPIKGFFILKRGPVRIRTAVGAFAELCLATRPQDLLFYFWTFLALPVRLRRTLHLILPASKIRKFNKLLLFFSDIREYSFRQAGHKQLSYCSFSIFNVLGSTYSSSHQQPSCSLEHPKTISHLEHFLDAICSCLLCDNNAYPLHMSVHWRIKLSNLHFRFY